MREVPQRTLSRMRGISASDFSASCASIRSAMRTTVAPRQLGERRAAVAKDPRVAVLVGADRPVDAHVGEHAGEHVFGARISGVLEVVLDAFERRLRLGMLELEPRVEQDARDASFLRVLEQRSGAPPA